MHISKHSLFRLKITVGCPLCTYPSIHVESLRIMVGCPRCCGVLCVHEGVLLCGVLRGVWCVVLVLVLVFGGGVVWCGVVCIFVLFFLSMFFFLFLALSLSFFSLLSSLLSSLFSSSFSFLLFSPPNTMERTDQPTRRPTSRHLNVIWRRASAQQSVLSLLLSPPSSLLPFPSSKKKEGTFYYRNISGEEFIFYYSFK